MGILPTLFAVFRSAFRSRVALELENFALRHQLNVLKRSVPRPRLTPADRYLWVLLSRVWQNWCAALAIVRHMRGVFDSAGSRRTCASVRRFVAFRLGPHRRLPAFPFCRVEDWRGTP
jgi:hypothetical protein